MALRGKPSTAHEYSPSGDCIHCGMSKKIVELLTHCCTKEREIESDGHWLGKPVEGDQ